MAESMEILLFACFLVLFLLQFNLCGRCPRDRILLLGKCPCALRISGPSRLLRMLRAFPHAINTAKKNNKQSKMPAAATQPMTMPAMAPPDRELLLLEDGGITAAVELETTPAVTWTEVGRQDREVNGEVKARTEVAAEDEEDEEDLKEEEAGEEEGSRAEVAAAEVAAEVAAEEGAEVAEDEEEEEEEERRPGGRRGGSWR